MKLNITRDWLMAKLAEMDAAGVDEFADAGVPEPVMVCKLQLHEITPKQHNACIDKDNKPTLPISIVKFGAVWEGSSEKQAMSENAIFGHWTPTAFFNASIANEAVIDKLVPGKKYYVTFTEAPD
jgi:hypothetical protein